MRVVKRIYLPFLLLWASQAFAAPTLPSTGVIDAGRVGQTLSERTAQAPRSMPTVQMPSSEAPEIPEALTKIKFKLSEVILEGNTVLSTEELSKLYQDKLNKDITIVDLFNLREEITSAYRDAGYVLIKVILPEQNFDAKGAKVKYKIVEGFIGKIKIEGDASPKQKLLIESYAKQVQLSKPLKTKIMERYALLSSDLKGLEVNYVLSPSVDEQGAADLLISTKRKTKVTGQVQYDDFGSVLMGPGQMSTLLGFNGLGGSLNDIMVNALATTTFNQLQFMQIADRYPVGPYGSAVNVSAYYTHTHPGGVLSDFRIYGESRAIAFALVHPVIRERTRNLNISLTGDGLFNTSDVKFLQATFFRDEIRSLRAAVEYDELRWNGLNIITATLSQGLPILGARLDGDLQAPLSRPNGNAVYTKFDTEISRLQMTESNFSALVGVRAQWGFQPLLSAEQFAFGGPLYGRGFDIGEIIGDRGVGTKYEIRYDTKPNWGSIQTAQFYTFYDYGAIWNIDTKFFASTLSAASVGGGIRASLAKHVDVDLYAVKPVVRGIATRDFSKETRFVLAIVARSD